MADSPQKVLSDLRAAADPVKAAFFPRFFRTGKGEYGEGDKFLGVTVPHMRRIARAHRELPLPAIERLLCNAHHEARLTGLLILLLQYQRGDRATRRRIARFYLDHLDCVNNWDLVDVTAPHILGLELLERKDCVLLDELAATGHLWRQRIAIVATLAFIRAGEFAHTLRLATALLNHPHDLIHKAVGWMLREVGKRDTAALKAFLNQHAPRMPRTMLRYAIEKFDTATQKHYRGMKELKVENARRVL